MTDTAPTTAAPAAVTAADTPATATALAPQQITVEQARGRRDQILADKTLCSKLMAGDKDLRAEMHKLNETIANQDIGALVQSALNGIPPGEFSNVTTDGILARHEYASAAKDLVPVIGKEAFQAFVDGRAFVTQERHDEAVALKRAIMSDREWLRAHREGSVGHREQMTKINLTLGCRIAEEKK